MVGLSGLGKASAVPGVAEGRRRPVLPGGPLVPPGLLVVGWPGRYCVLVAPIRVAFRRGRYAAAVGAGPALRAGGPPIVRIQPERPSREVPLGRLSVPPGEGVQLELSQRSRAGVRSRRHRLPVS